MLLTAEPSVQPPYPHFGTGILSGFCPSQIFDQHGAQILWEWAEGGFGDTAAVVQDDLANVEPPAVRWSVPPLSTAETGLWVLGPAL